MIPRCRFFNNPGGCWKGDNCPYRHLISGPKEVEPCRYFHSSFGCRKDHCRFLHTTSNSGSSELVKHNNEVVVLNIDHSRMTFQEIQKAQDKFQFDIISLLKDYNPKNSMIWLPYPSTALFIDRLDVEKAAIRQFGKNVTVTATEGGFTLIFNNPEYTREYLNKRKFQVSYKGVVHDLWMRPVEETASPPKPINNQIQEKCKIALQESKESIINFLIERTELCCEANPTSPNLFSSLAPDILQVIFSDYGSFDLLQLGMVCKQFFQISSMDMLWHRKWQHWKNMVGGNILFKKRYEKYLQMKNGVDTKDIIVSTNGYLWKPYYLFVRYEVRWIDGNDFQIACSSRTNSPFNIQVGEVYEITEKKSMAEWVITDGANTGSVSSSCLGYELDPLSFLFQPVIV